MPNLARDQRRLLGLRSRLSTPLSLLERYQGSSSALSHDCDSTAHNLFFSKWPCCFPQLVRLIEIAFPSKRESLKNEFDQTSGQTLIITFPDGMQLLANP